MTQLVSDCLRTLRLTLGRRNANDPDSSDSVMLQYLNDFANLTMTDDIKIFEQFGNLTFTIDQTVVDGVYTFNDVGAADQFSNVSLEAFISVLSPVNNSTSWNRLEIYMDPGIFYDQWGVNNYELIVPGYPTQMLYFGNEMVFRTIPEQSYQVHLYGYKVVPVFGDGDPALPYDYWMRYLAYGAALNYARDYRFDRDEKARIKEDFSHERKLLLTRTHNQRKMGRAQPSF